MASAPRSPQPLGAPTPVREGERPRTPARTQARRALAGVGFVLLSCALIGVFIHPAEPPALAALTRSEGVSSSVGEGPQFCGRQGPAIGHKGTWVIELWIGGREHCVVAYPRSDRERQLLASLPTRPPLTAWHSSSMVWQVEGPAGMLVDYDTRRAEAETALHQHRVRQAWLLGVGFTAVAGSVGLGLRARGSRAKATPVGLT